MDAGVGSVRQHKFLVRYGFEYSKLFLNVLELAFWDSVVFSVVKMHPRFLLNCGIFS